MCPRPLDDATTCTLLYQILLKIARVMVIYVVIGFFEWGIWVDFDVGLVEAAVCV